MLISERNCTSESLATKKEGLRLFFYIDCLFHLVRPNLECDLADVDSVFTLVSNEELVREGVEG